MHFDPFADFSEFDSFEALAPPRDAPRIGFDARTGAFFVTRYEDVSFWLLSKDLTTRRPEDRAESASCPCSPERRAIRHQFSKWPLFSDGEYHGELRACLRGAFQGAEAALRATASKDGWVPPCELPSPIDWLRVVAEPAALSVLAQLLMTSRAEASHLVSLGVKIMDTFSLRPANAVLHDALAAMAEIQDWLRERLACSSVSSDGFGGALRRIRETPSLGMEAAGATLAQVVTGTYDPLVSAITTLAIVAQPCVLSSIDASDLASEVVRITTPFRFARRFACRDLEICGQAVRRGSLVYLGLASANLESSAFEAPTRIRSDRSRGHLGFGRGQHRRPGGGIVTAALVRLCRELLERRVFFRAREVRCCPELPLRRYQSALGELAPF
jgi:cytochrome P450